MSSEINKRYKKLIDIRISSITQNNIKCVMLDIDSTLLIWRGENIGEKELAWCQSIMKNKIDIILVSNAHKYRAAEIAKQLDVKYISPAFKPWPFGLIKAARICAAKRENCIMIGDQLFTDKLAAILAGIKFILLEPMSSHEFGWTKINRSLEKIILRRKKL